MTVQWGRDTDSKNIRSDLKNFGFSGDYFLGPLFVDQEWAPYDTSVLFVDPAGRGKDECAWSIVKTLNGIMYVMTVKGMNKPVDETMIAIAQDAKLHNVNLIQVEPNYAGEMWINTFYPYLAKVWAGDQQAVTTRKGQDIIVGTGGGCRVEEAKWAQGMKEMRIIDTLEPVMNSHRMVIDEAIAHDPILMHQVSHIAKERNCLTMDDRIDSLAGAVSYCSGVMMMDVGSARQAKKDDEFDQMLEDFTEDCHYGHLRNYRKSRRSGTEVYST